MMNRRGSSTKPWGTPEVTGRSEMWMISAGWAQPGTYYLNQLNGPEEGDLLRRVVWQCQRPNSGQRKCWEIKENEDKRQLFFESFGDVGQVGIGTLVVEIGCFRTVFFRIGVIAAVLNYAAAIPDMSRARERWNGEVEESPGVGQESWIMTLVI